MEKYKGEILPGCAYPLGATWDGNGVNFALYSAHAAAVTLCLFQDANDNEEYVQINLSERTEFIWHIYLPGIKPGQIYGYRVDGDFAPEKGHLFNPNKLLVDPYSKAITGATLVTDVMHGFVQPKDKKTLPFEKDMRNSAAVMNKCVVINNQYDWENIQKPKIPAHETIIYEVSVKGFTARHPEIPASERGTFKAMASEPVINYVKSLGVTAIELLPSHHFVHNAFLIKHGLRNYWGYNTLGFFAPHAEYSSSGSLGQQVDEFKDMIKTYHRAGLEVILDVVYNHTGEGDHLGPTLSFRGIDNASYYRLNPKNKQLYVDYTGTGNTINMQNPRCLQLIMDSLRYWATEMQVDGFRFDLASTLGRGKEAVQEDAAFFHAIQQDPVLSKCKLIAEPWDLGPDGYWVGKFPSPWSEWNGKYRDTLRRYWRGDEGQMKKLALRMNASPDLYQKYDKSPGASINFITCHDGFTLNDLVSYNNKYNIANKEGNRDGDNHNNSFNYGVEGETNDSAIVSIREKQKRNMLSSLLFSHGIPMISHGDEYGRTQHGNNNAYCQDSEIAWMDWNRTDQQNNLFEFVKKVISIRKKYPELSPQKYPGNSFSDEKVPDNIRWINPDGTDATEVEWNCVHTRTTGMLLNGNHLSESTKTNKNSGGNTLLLILNSFWETVNFKMPDYKENGSWEILLDTSLPKAETLDKVVNSYPVEARSVVLLRR